MVRATFGPAVELVDGERGGGEHYRSPMTSKSVEVWGRGVRKGADVWVDVGTETKMANGREPAVAKEDLFCQIN